MNSQGISACRKLAATTCTTTYTTNPPIRLSYRVRVLSTQSNKEAAAASSSSSSSSNKAKHDKIESAKERSQVSNDTKHAKYEGYILTRHQRKAIRLIDPSSSTTSTTTATIPNQAESSVESNNESNNQHKFLSKMKEQALLEEIKHMENNPSPWSSLLRYPSRARWRSTPQKPIYLSETQQQTITKADRTAKQLRRTYNYIIQNHDALSHRRENERRRIVNARRNEITDSISFKTKRGIDKNITSVYYKPEYTLCSLKFRLVPNYCITRRILSEVQGLLGREGFRPSRIVDVGCGVGSASAAALDHFYEDVQKLNKEKKKKNRDNDEDATDDGEVYSYRGVEWIHAIDPSQSMRDASKIVLEAAMEGNKNQHYHENKKQEKKMMMNDGTSPVCNTRLTFGEKVTSTTSSSASKSNKNKMGDSNAGSFDLALCSYTLSELPTLASTLAMAAIVWEKLKHNGVAIFIEPGTPDGFNSLRSVRSMLLDCCPPKQDDNDDKVFLDGYEECHVIAPCTHNGTCPMVRHQKNFKKASSVHGTDGRAMNMKNMDNMMMGLEEEDQNLPMNIQDYLDDANNPGALTLDDFEENDVNRDEEENDDILDEEDDDTDTTEKFDDSSAVETDAFETAFCSFVHGMSGGKRRAQGEKFAYLVVQKRKAGETADKDLDERHNPFHETDIVNLLSESFQAAKSVKPNLKKKEKRSKLDAERHDELIDELLDIEDRFLDSSADPLGLELVRGDAHRHSWGRIIRAPIKKKGHVILDFCASETNEEGVDEGRIVRHFITRKESARVAPGMYGASRKSRWGGLWPDVTRYQSETK